MISKIKALGLAVVAVAAFSAMMVSAAQASKLDLGAETAVLTGHSEPIAGQEKFQEHFLTVQNTAKTQTLQAKCDTASFEGTTQGQTIEEATVTATYGTGKGVFSEAQGCSVGGIKAQVLMNGCKYTLTGAGQAAGTLLVDVIGCTEGKQIEINVAAGGCALKIPAQNGLSHLVGKQLTSQEATVEATVTGIKVQQSGSVSCPDGTTAHTGTNGGFSGNTIVKAFQDAGTKQVTKHGHQYTEHLCGTQVTIQTT